MSTPPFKDTRMTLSVLPLLYLVIAAVTLVAYVTTAYASPLQYWPIAVVSMLMSYWGYRVRNTLIERHPDGISRAKIYLSLHAPAIFLVPVIYFCFQELNDEKQKQTFMGESHLDAYVAPLARNPKLNKILRDIQVSAMVAFMGLVIIAAVQAADYYLIVSPTTSQAQPQK